MKPKNDRTQRGQPRPAGSPAPTQRFRIQKLEERIAPGHYNPHGKWVGNNLSRWCS